MIKNISLLNRFYQEMIKKDKITYKQALCKYEALLNEAISLGAINSQNILDGLETDIRIAKALNSLSK